MAFGGKPFGAAIAAGALLALTGPAWSAPRLKEGPSTASPTDLLRYDRDVRLETGRFLGAAPYRRCATTRFEAFLTEVVRADFDRLPVDTRKDILRIAITCEALHRTDAGARVLRRLEPLAIAEQIPEVNNRLLIDAKANGRPLEAAWRLTTLIDQDPARVATWWPRFINPIVRDSREDAEISTALLRRLTALEWKDTDSATAARNGWARQYALRLLDKGDKAGAERALARMDETYSLLMVAQDRRFSALWPKLEAAGRFDWRKSAEAALARRQAAAKAAPDTLASTYDAMQLLRALQRYDEAIALGETVRKQLSSGVKFSDADDFGDWILGELGYALLDTGRAGEAQAAFEQAIAMGERGGSAVSQRINWAEMLNGLDRPKEALALVAQLDPKGTSPYGVMWADAVRVCAQSGLDPAAADRLLATMRARETDNEAALTRALLCLDRQDEAAALYVRRLGSPLSRDDALEAFRVVRAPPVLTPRQKEMERRRQAVLARPEVVKALGAAGRGIDLPLAGPYWGDV